MKSGLLLFFGSLLIASSAFATVWLVLSGNNFFAPSDLTIAQGDTVVWSNIEGTHNVAEVSQPPLFSSGEPAPAPWEYQFVFNVPLGTYDYECELHAPEMAGSVTVEEYTYAPEIKFDENHSIPAGATVGHGFQIAVVAANGDPTLIGFAVSIDDTLGWSEWFEYSVFLIADPTLGLFPEGTVVLSNEGLAAGAHMIYARARDWRTVSPTISRSVTVADGFRPTMDPGVTGTYDGTEFYPDGSAYHAGNSYAVMVLHATAQTYHGQINAYRHQESSGPWSYWFSRPTVFLSDLAVGEHTFRFMARDIAGAYSDTVEFLCRLVEQTLTDSIIIVDETRDGTGGAGSPNDGQVDNFYEAMVGSFPHRQIDYATHQIGGACYLSPLDLHDAGLVLYHADDKAAQYLLSTRGILAEYMDHRGRVILSGWDLLAPFGIVGVDSASYGDSVEFSSGTRFPFRYLGLHYALRSSTTSPREATGFSGIADFPSISIDPAKVPASWNGALDKCWVFQERSDCIVIGTLTVSNPGQNPLEGRTAAYYYYSPNFRVAVFGIPLYFCHQQEAQALFDVLLPTMLVAGPFSNSAARIEEYALNQNYPNPFNATTTLRYAIPQSGLVRLTVFNIMGQKVASLVDSYQDAGYHSIIWNGTNLASGVYICQLQTANQTVTQKMLLLK